MFHQKFRTAAVKPTYFECMDLTVPDWISPLNFSIISASSYRPSIYAGQSMVIAEQPVTIIQHSPTAMIKLFIPELLFFDVI